ncbi:hypothetical protein M5K25_004662 [Dendrobium thyrsiflorum]|uniref:Uncharacterized protein n=1 Tax=Dendrobium thyrsiflorum TaxID=117978 RepID=A0ABD0VMM4_DENTH
MLVSVGRRQSVFDEEVKGSNEWELFVVGCSIIVKHPYYEALLNAMKRTWALKGTPNPLSMNGFDAIGEHTGDDHDRNIMVPFGGKPSGSEGPDRDRLPMVPFSGKTIGSGSLYCRSSGAAPVSHPTALEKSAYRRRVCRGKDDGARGEDGGAEAYKSRRGKYIPASP